MSNSYANFINETEKLFKTKKTKVFLFFSAIIPAGTAGLFSVLQSKFGIQPAGFPILILSIFTTFLLPLFIFGVAGDLFAGEIASKTLKLPLVRPISRFNIFLSKNLALLFYIFCFLIVILASSIISQAALQLHFNSIDIIQVIKAYLVSILPLLTLGLLATLLSLFFSSSGGTIIACVVLLVVGKSVPFLSPALSKIIPFTYTDWYTLWLGNSVSPKQLVIPSMLLISYLIIFFSLGFYLFDKKEL